MNRLAFCAGGIALASALTAFAIKPQDPTLANKPQVDTCLMFADQNLAKGNGNWFTYFRFSQQQLTFQAGDTLQYDIFLDPKIPAPKGGVDIDSTDNGDALRDLGLQDDQGVRAHGDGRLEKAVGHWITRSIPLDKMAGRTSSQWNVVFEGDEYGWYVQFIDNVVVKHSDGTETPIYQNGPAPSKALLSATGYSKEAFLLDIDRARVKEGADLEPLYAQQKERAERLKSIDAIRQDIEVAKKFEAQNPDPELSEHIQEAELLLGQIEAKAEPTEEEIQAALHAAKHALSHTHPMMEQYTGHLVGHAHIDLQWLWEWQEGIVATHDTFNQAVKFMDEFPGFTFSQSSSCLYETTEEHYPELFKKIQEKVKKGQWEIVGGRVCEGDTNMISPESHARQFLYGQSYFREKFGKTAVVGWEPDTFGHTIQMPQILKMGGCKYYYFCRGGKNKPLFWWEGLDGTKILAFDEPASGSWYNSDISYKQFQEMLDFQKNTGSKDSLWVYGVGNHGGGPTRENIEEALEMMKNPGLPKVKFSTASQFFKKLETYDLTKIPVVNQELNPVFDGCYTTHSEIKQMNRDAEAATTSAEAVASVASLFGFRYPTADFRKNWEEICFNHHHDTLPGSGIHAPYERTKTQLGRVIMTDKDIATRALETLALGVKPDDGGISTLVFNPNGWTRSGWINLYLVQSGWAGDKRLDPQNTVAIAPDGTQTTFEELDPASHYGRVWVNNVPAFGYSVIHFVNGTPAAQDLEVRDDGYTMENKNFIVEFDRQGGFIKRLFDKRANREVTPGGLGRLETHYEGDRGMSAWVLGNIVKVENTKVTGASAAQGKGWASVRFEYRMPSVNNPRAETVVAQTFRLDADGTQIDCNVDCDYHHVGLPSTQNPMFRVAFPTTLQAPTATYEVPFGALSRPTDGQECAALEWADLSAGDYGVSVLNDSKHGHSADGSTLRLSLIRCSFDPDPQPNPGLHHWRYSIVPHQGDWRAAHIARRAAEFNQPLMAETVPFDSKGTNPKTFSFAGFTDPNIVPTCLKRAEDGKGYIIRMYEGTGAPSRGNLVVSGALSGARWTNFLEDDQGNAMTQSSPNIPLTLHGFEIRNVRVNTKLTPMQ